MATENRSIDLTDKQILALKAVAYGCNGNKRLVGSSYVTDIFESNPQEISFFEAMHIVYEIIGKLEDAEDGK